MLEQRCGVLRPRLPDGPGFFGGRLCTLTSLVPWDGLGTPSDPLGAPAGTVLLFTDAWALFANGTAAQPVNMRHGLWGSPAQMPLRLDACTNASVGAFTVAVRPTAGAVADNAVRLAVVVALIDLQTSYSAPAGGGSAAIVSAVNSLNTLVNALQQQLGPAAAGGSTTATPIAPETAAAALSLLADVLTLSTRSSQASMATANDAVQPLVTQAVEALTAAVSVNAASALCSAGSGPLAVAASPLFVAASCTDLTAPAAVSSLFGAGIRFDDAPALLSPLPPSTFSSGNGATFGSGSSAPQNITDASQVVGLMYFLPFDPHRAADVGAD